MSAKQEGDLCCSARSASCWKPCSLSVLRQSPAEWILSEGLKTIDPELLVRFGGIKALGREP